MKIKITRNKQAMRQRDPQKLTKLMHNQLIKLWKRCVQEFVLETSKHIAIDTGMSMASLLPLAAKVRLASTIASKISGASNGARGSYTSTRYGYTGSKSVAHGKRLGKEAYKLSFGTPQNPKLHFEFDIVVLQHYLHESVGNYARSHHWQSIKHGQDAFLSAWDILVDDYVNAREINNWLLTGAFKSVK